MKFRKETEFQETEIGKIPRDWRTFSLKEAFELYKGTTPSTKDSRYWGGTIPFVTPTDITAINDLNMIYLTKTEKYLTEEGAKSKNLRIVPRGSLLFTSRATIGYLAINNVDVTINQGVIALIPKRKDVNILYYYYYLLRMKKKFEELAGGSTYKEISMAMFSKTIIPQPPLQEQNRIANILSTIDRAIELYHGERERLEHLKRSLMSELLTGRIRVREENGRLSFYRETEFQETEIGKIPRDWRIEKLGNIVVKAKMGGTPKRSVREYWGGDIPFAKIEDITSSHKYLFKTSTTITRLGLENSNAWIVPRDSLLITIYGTLGAVAINKIELATNQAIVSIVPKKDIVDVEFLYYWYSFFQPNWNKYVKKSTQPNLTLEIIVNSLIPLPPLNEQKGIVRILSLIDRAIELYHGERGKLERLKRGLMDLLLTGKVRVVDGDVGS